MNDSMTVGDLCNRDVIVVTEDISLRQAAQLMRDHHVGSLVVVSDTARGRAVIGMLTDRDITVMGVARDFDPQSLRVADIMSTDPVTAEEGDSVNEVLGLMRTRGVRRIPVTTTEGLLAGIISIDDLLDVMAEEMQGFVQAMARAQTREARMRV
ncbi:CBS domain-containing protein [Noviherbaspirillum humi]|uniref:CBS domain-containing protein n=1 Tax=Noviherbaspirillum humi TaxID=1688639 RepID=A0A239FE85_9BURK|nr:CBS domain-containing protein [Noviherbaspirillum humi]SNS55071.1 CBS domain-containing protein [Noviherbaspirillum humi]